MNLTRSSGSHHSHLNRDLSWVYTIMSRHKMNDGKFTVLK